MNAMNPVLTRSDSSQGAGSSNGALPNPQSLNNMFLQLLVAQLQNQSPLNPMDPTQFVGQLAQFSELSEVTQIDQILQKSLPTSSGSGNGSATGHIPLDTATPTSHASAAAQSATRNRNSNLPAISNSRPQGVF